MMEESDLTLNRRKVTAPPNVGPFDAPLTSYSNEIPPPPPPPSSAYLSSSIQLQGTTMTEDLMDAPRPPMFSTMPTKKDYDDNDIIRRKTNTVNNYNNINNTINTMNTNNTNADDHNKNNINEDQKSRKKHMMSWEPELDHNDVLALALLPPLLVVFAFGGEAALLAVCVGSMATYIFDLIGFIEGTVGCIFLTLVAIWVTLVWASRHLLLQSITNGVIIFVLGIILVYTFIIAAGHFRALRIEFDALFYLSESVMFSTAPLVASCVCTWFLVVELPLLDLPTCFSVTYFAYIMWLGRPRVPSSSMLFPTSQDKFTPNYVLSEEVITSMQLVPVVISPILHLVTHHNVLGLESNVDVMSGLIISGLLPGLLMAIAAEAQADYLPLTQRRARRRNMGNIRIAFTLLLTLLLQSSPLLDDLKIFSGLGEPSATWTMCGMLVLLIGGFSLHSQGPVVSPDEKQLLQSKKNDDDTANTTHSYMKKHDSSTNEEEWSGDFSLLGTLMIGVSSFLLGILLNLDQSIWPLCVGAGVAIAEVYRLNVREMGQIMQNAGGIGSSHFDTLPRSSASSSLYNQRNSTETFLSCADRLYYLVLVVFGAGSVGLIGLYFTFRTLWFLDLDLDLPTGIGLGFLLETNTQDTLEDMSENGDDFYTFGPVMSVQRFCILSALSASVAVAAPVLVLRPLGVADAVTDGTCFSTRKSPHRSQQTVLPLAGMGSPDNGLGADYGGKGLQGPGICTQFIKTCAHRYAFPLVFSTFSFFIALLELVVLEQDWEEYGVTVDDVYPSYLLSGSACILIFLAWRLARSPAPLPDNFTSNSNHSSMDTQRLIGWPTMIGVLLVQACKLLRLVDFSTEFCVSMMVLGLSYTLPFLVSFDDIFKYLTVPPGSTAARVNGVTVGFLTSIFYIGYAAQGAFWGYQHVYGTLLKALYGHQVDGFERAAAALSGWLVFVAIYLSIFKIGATTNVVTANSNTAGIDSSSKWRLLWDSIRSAALIGAAICALISAQAVRLPIQIGLVTDSMIPYMTVEWGIEPSNNPGLTDLDDRLADHSAFFLLVSTSMALSTWLGLFPIRRAAPRVLFLMWFSYCAAKASLGWCFPIALGLTSPHQGTLQLPWLACLSSAILGTSTVLHATVQASAARSNRGSLGKSSSSTAPNNIIFTCLCLHPVILVVWAAVEDSLLEHMGGILSLAALEFLFVGITIRMNDLYHLLNFGSQAGGVPLTSGLNTTSGSQSQSNISQLGFGSPSGKFLEALSGTNAGWPAPDSFTALTATMCGILGFIWMAIACIHSSHISSDLGVLLSSLLLLLADRGSLFGDKYTPQLQVAGGISSVWLINSALYSIFVMHSELEEILFKDAGNHVTSTLRSGDALGFLADLPTLDFLPDRVVSIWSADGWLPPLLATSGVILCIPVITFSLMKRRDESDDWIFAFALLAAVAAMIGPIWSIRLLGFLGIAFGAHRLNELSTVKKISDRML